MKRFFLDTNVFLRIFTADNSQMLMECLVLIEKIKKGKITAITSNLVLSEIVWTLGSSYRFPKDKIIEAVRSILNIPGLIVEDEYQLIVALDIYQKYPIKFIDALISSIYEIQNKTLTIVSYDRDFDKLGVIRKEPQEII